MNRKKLKKILAVLNLQLGEVFKLNNENSSIKYRFDKNWLYCYGHRWEMAKFEDFVEVLLGDYDIVKIKGKDVQPKRIKFILDGCDISFTATAPEDITLKQLLDQTSRIKPDWCACGICYDDIGGDVEIAIDYDDIKKVDNSAPCAIKDKADIQKEIYYENK